MQRVQAAEQCHVKDLVQSLQQEVAKLKASNERLHSHCKGKADKEHMHDVSKTLQAKAGSEVDNTTSTCTTAVWA